MRFPKAQLSQSEVCKNRFNLPKQELIFAKARKRSIFDNLLTSENNGWNRLYKHVRRRICDAGISPLPRDQNGKLIFDDKSKAKTFAKYFASVFGAKFCKQTFTIADNSVQFELEACAICKHVRKLMTYKSAEFMKLREETMWMCLIGLFQISINNSSWQENYYGYKSGSKSVFQSIGKIWSVQYWNI